MREVHQVNLQRQFGGGEVYTRFLCAALAAAGWPVVLYVHPEAAFWRRLDFLPGVRLVAAASPSEVAARLPERALVITHAALGRAEAAHWLARHVLTGFVHMPLYGRNVGGLPSYRRLFGVSQHVLDSARAAGLGNAWPAPLYGVADLERGAQRGSAIRRHSVFDWDRRKLRDRVLGTLSPPLSSLLAALPASLRPGAAFTRRAGLTIGIVSRLTPIKQWPLLFRHIAPVIARFPGVNIEIFGSGGYASVRDLRRALRPAARQVRFWGQQRDVRRVYGVLDYVLSGLPEKEALGLNLIEAQCCGTPVLAVNAPPFVETVAHGSSGFLFDDPRGDDGQSFAALLEQLSAGAPRPDPLLATAHLQRFSMAAFRSRLDAAMRDLA